MPQHVDLVVLGGTIVDGTGNVPFVGDLAIKDGKIVYVSSGDNPRISREMFLADVETIDAMGKLVTPGWIDVHTHLDAQVTWDPAVSPVAANGVTTVIMGNCGVGFAPCHADQRQFLMSLMEGVEDIPLGSITAGMKWEWETFPEFMDALASRQFALDVGAFVAHGPVRAYVMGERANAMDRPGGPTTSPITKDEIERVAAVVGEAIRAGAVGFSTSRTLLHRDSSGVLVPGTLAPEEELLAVGRAMSEAGGGVFEMASDFMCGDDEEASAENHAARLKHFGREWVWMRKLSKRYGLSLNFCIGMPSSIDTPHGYRAMMQQMESANSQGCNIRAQVFVRPQAIISCWDSVSHPFVDSPSFSALRKELREEARREHGGTASPEVWLPKLRQRLCEDGGLRRVILEETLRLGQASEGAAAHGIQLPSSIEDGAGNLNGSVTRPGALAKMYLDQQHIVFKWDETYEPRSEDSAASVAVREGLSFLEVLYDWLCEKEGTQVCSLYFMNYTSDSCDDTLEMLRFPGTIPGLGDTGAHLGFLCDPTAHTYLLTYLARDRIRGPCLPIEEVVKFHSADCADAFGLDDRGRLLPGKLADINIVDLQNLRIHVPKLVHDLPENATRWVQTCEGYDCTIKSGVVSQRSGQPTGALPGRLVRGPGYRGARPRTSSGLRQWLSETRWEAEQKGMELLVNVLGPTKLEEFGNSMNESMPLKSRL